MASASLVKSKQHGREVFRLSFYDNTGNRRWIRLGDIGRTKAEGILSRVRHIVNLKASGQPLDASASEWLSKISDDLSSKLAASGLISERQTATLASFIDAYLDTRKDLKKNTLRNYRAARVALVEYFGGNCNLRDINAGRAIEWRQAMVNDGSATATISKHVRVARQYFKLAISKGIITTNPFSEVKAGGEHNDARQYFVDRPTIEKVLAATEDPEWKLIIALSRFGGVRCPSETLALKWTDINWADNRITLPSSKTEHQGKAFRILPLFPELKPYLDRAYHAAPEGAVYCIQRYRDAQSSNLRTQFLRILRRAGVAPWERLFHNLRASRQTELENSFPGHVVCAWLGNSPKTANKHYLMVTDEHFEKALEGGAKGGAIRPQKGGAKGGTADESKALQFVAKCFDTNSLGEKTLAPVQLSRYPRQDSNLQPPA